MSDKTGFAQMSDKYSARDHEKNRAAAPEENNQLQRLLWKLRLPVYAFFLLIVPLILVLVPGDFRSLKGTWAYDETASMQFTGKSRGVITLADSEYPFTYSVEENTLTLSFDNAYIAGASYSFTAGDNTLTLSGEDGTTGGTYTLTRIRKRKSIFSGSSPA